MKQTKRSVRKKAKMNRHTNDQKIHGKMFNSSH